MDEELKTKFFKILDEYYTLKRPNELGVEPENKLMALIDSYAEKEVNETQIDDRLVLIGMFEANKDNISVEEIIAVLKGQVKTLEAELKALGGENE